MNDDIVEDIYDNVDEIEARLDAGDFDASFFQQVCLTIVKIMNRCEYIEIDTQIDLLLRINNVFEIRRRTISQIEAELANCCLKSERQEQISINEYRLLTTIMRSSGILGHRLLLPYLTIMNIVLSSDRGASFLETNPTGINEREMIDVGTQLLGHLEG